MNSDIRLSVGFWQHPKTKKTVKRLGLEGIRSLQTLWLWAAVNRPDGMLTGMDWEDIELAADWHGEERAFFDLCLGMWLDQTENVPALHNWQKHNPWQAEAEARSDASRLSRMAGTFPKEYQLLVKAGVSGVTKEEYETIRKCDDRLTTVKRILSKRASPAPSPSPDPEPETKRHENTQSSLGNGDPTRGATAAPKDFSVLGDEPGKDFYELRIFYDENAREEAPLAGFAEYKQLRASKSWPGQAPLYSAILRHAGADPGWKQFAPGLGKFLREHWWKKNPRTLCAASGEKPANRATLLEKNMSVAAEVLADRATRK